MSSLMRPATLPAVRDNPGPSWLAAPPWALFWLVSSLIAVPGQLWAWKASLFDLLGATPVPVGAGSGSGVLRLVNVADLTRPVLLAAAVATVLAAPVRGLIVQHRYRLTAASGPALAEIAAFARSAAPEVAVRGNTRRLDIRAFVYPLGYRRAALAVCGGLVMLWRRDRAAAEAVIRHELSHHDRGDTLLLGTVSSLEAVLRRWGWILIAFVVVPVSVAWVAETTDFFRQVGTAGSDHKAWQFLTLILPGLLWLLLTPTAQLLAVITMPIAASWSAELAADHRAAERAGSAALTRALCPLRSGRSRSGVAALAVRPHHASASGVAPGARADRNHGAGAGGDRRVPRCLACPAAVGHGRCRFGVCGRAGGAADDPQRRARGHRHLGAQRLARVGGSVRDGADLARPRPSVAFGGRSQERCPVTEVPAGVFALLRRYRHREGLSQEALAEACGMSNRAVSDLERGVSRPRARTVRMLAEVLRLSAAERAEFVSAVPAVTRPTGAAFAGLLRAHRTAAHLSQAELAARALISARAISDLERGMNRAPRRQTVILLSDALELDGTACAEFHAAARAALTAAHPSSRPEARQSPDGSLPLFPWPLIGREQELDRLLELVADPSVRLLTLTGMGGVGKTRLAAEVGAILAGRGDRVVFVTLTAARTASEAVDAMVAALGVTDADEATVLAAVGRSIAAERTTLVLDNVEQIPDAARIVSAVVAGAAGSGVPGGGAAGTVVVTSRVVLRLAGERELPVSPLAAAPSGRLFAERARAASPEWTPLESDAGVLAEVCRQMDGLPLALELLAPWVRVLPLRVIRDRLATGLDLVSAANADVAARHRSLSVVLDASHLLLDPATQAVFRRLAVFPAAFEAETAEAVCGGHDDASPDGREINVLSAVAALRDASLLTAERDSDGELRLCYLHIVREYAAAALAGSGELAWMRARHAAAFARLAEIAAPRLTLADQGFWLERLDRAVDDLRAALAWYLAQDDATSVVRMSGNLWRYWYLRGLPREGRNWLRQALAAPGCGRDAADSVPAGTDVATAQYGAGVLHLPDRRDRAGAGPLPQRPGRVPGGRRPRRSCELPEQPRHDRALPCQLQCGQETSRTGAQRGPVERQRSGGGRVLGQSRQGLRRRRTAWGSRRTGPGSAGDLR